MHFRQLRYEMPSTSRAYRTVAYARSPRLLHHFASFFAIFSAFTVSALFIKLP
jgi:hypothetical protein